MKRIFCLILVVFILFGCAKRKSQETTEIVFSAGGAPNEVRFWKDLIQEFEELNPHIKVTLRVLPSATDQQHQYYLTALGTKTSNIDVLRMDIIWIPEFVAAGWLCAIDGIHKDRYLDIINKVDVYNNQLYAVPWNIDVGLLYYRKDLLEKYGYEGPPKYWDQLVEMAKKVQADKPNLWGFLWQGKQYEGLVCNFVEFIYSNGGSVSFKNGKLFIDSEENRQATRFMQDLIWADKISPPNTFSEMTEEPCRLLFQQGNALFMRNWPYAWALLDKDKVEVAPLPCFRGKRPAAALGGWHLGINRYSRHSREAVQFVRFMTSYNSQKKLALELSWMPSMKDVYLDEELKEKAPFISKLFDSAQYATPRPITAEYSRLSDLIQLYINKCIAERNEPERALRNIEDHF